MDKLTALRELEQDFRLFFEESRVHTLDTAFTLDEFRHIISKAERKFRNLESGPLEGYARAINEEVFFAEGEDVTAVQLIRYMPAIYHHSEFFELKCVLSGSVICYVGKQRIPLSDGDVLILAPRTDHADCTYEETGIMINVLVRKSTFERRFLNLMSDSGLLRSFFEDALYRAASTPYLLFRTSDVPLLQGHILPLLEECRLDSRYKNTCLSSLLQLFFVSLLRKHEMNVIIPTMDPSVMNEKTIYILEYINNNVATITLNHLSSFFNYSERQMQRIIRTATGMSFGEVIKKLRMQKAEELLANSDMKISEIAEYLGYYDDSSFRQAFRSHSGLSPSEYRSSIFTKSKNV